MAAVGDTLGITLAHRDDAGEVVVPDAPPTATLLVGGVPSAAVIAVAAVAGLAGFYHFGFTVPAAAPGEALELLAVFTIAAEPEDQLVKVGDVAACPAPYSVIPLDRGTVDVGNRITFAVQFRNEDGSELDPYELRQVLIKDAASGATIFTVGAADIVRDAAGRYHVETPVAVAESVTYADVWYFTPFAGVAEATRTFSRAAVEGAAGDLLVSIEALKRDELKGVDLRDNAGEPFEDAFFESSIRRATDHTAALLNIQLTEVVVVERHHYSLDAYQNFARFELDLIPAREILSITAEYSSSASVRFPVEWARITHEKWGEFNLVPTYGTIQQFLISGNGSVLPPLLAGIGGQFEWWPGLWVIEYRAGFAPGNVPPRIQKAIALRAAIDALNQAGEMIIGSGIASQSISIGGMSRSVSTTSSATNAGHGALIIQYEKQLKDLIPQIRAQYHGIALRVA